MPPELLDELLLAPDELEELLLEPDDELLPDDEPPPESPPPQPDRSANAPKTRRQERLRVAGIMQDMAPCVADVVTDPDVHL